MAFFASCNFGDYLKSQFPEAGTQNLNVDGTLLLPVATADVSLDEFIPESQDSTKYWIEVDDQNLLHIKAFKDNVVDISAQDLGFTADVPAGTPVPDATLPDLQSNTYAIPSVQDIPGVFYVAAPKVTAYVQSELPLSYEVLVKSLYFNNSKTATDTTFPVSITIPVSPAVPPNNVYTQAVVDTNNFPQFPDALMIKPDQMSFTYDVHIPSQTLQYDLSLTYGVTVDLVIDIPFVFYARDVQIIDTTAFNLDLTKYDVDSLSIDLKMIVDNGIALGGRFYMILTDTLFTDTIGVIPAGSPDLVNDTINLVVAGKPVTASAAFQFLPAVTDQQGEPVQSTQTITHIKMPNYLVQNMKKSGYKQFSLILVAKLDTYNASQGQIIKVYSTNRLKLKIGAKIDYGVSF